MKQVEGFKNVYITNEGKVFNSKINRNMATKRVGSGYEGLNLWNYDEKKHITKYVHRLVAETFLPNPNNYPEVNHKDGNKFNNNVNNLEWCSISHNRKHTRRELKHNLNILKVTVNGNTKEYEFCKQYCEENDVKYTTLMNVLNGHRNKPKEWSHIEFEYKGIKI